MAEYKIFYLAGMCIKKAGSVLRQMGVSRVLIHHDSGAYLYDTGLLESVRRDLEDNGMAVRELPGVKPIRAWTWCV